MKCFAIQWKSTPDQEGYHDWGFLINDYEPGMFVNGNVSATASITWRGVVSAQPNPNMFIILKDNLQDVNIKKFMVDISPANRSWCAKCNRTYCKNCVTLGSAKKDPRIGCKLYARLKPNTPGEGYYGAFMSAHPKFGRCILVNEGKELPSLQPSSAQDGARYSLDNKYFKCEEIFVHHGYTGSWEGSAGCVTIPPDSQDIFFSYFSEGEKIRIELFDYSTRTNPLKEEPK